jgi:hypothetical protein
VPESVIELNITFSELVRINVINTKRVDRKKVVKEKARAKSITLIRLFDHFWLAI